MNHLALFTRSVAVLHECQQSAAAAASPLHAGCWMQRRAGQPALLLPAAAHLW